MTPTLSVDPPTRCFRGTQEAELAAALAAQDRATVVYGVQTAADVLLGPDGKTQGPGDRLSTLAFYQICRACCPGLYRFTTELAGGERPPERGRADYSFAEALEVYNRVVRRRFASRLAGLRLVRDAAAGRVDGVVGALYRRLSNHALYERSRSLLGRRSKPPLFYEAVVAGRWMLLRFYEPRTLAAVVGPGGERDRYLPGYHFANNEVGLAGVRATALLLREAGRTAALCPAGRPLVHRGPSFERRLARALEAVPGRLAAPGHYAGRLAALRDAGLGLGPPATRDKRAGDLAHLLVRQGLTAGLAKEVLADLDAQGSYDDRPLPESLRQAARPGRNAYDLFNALGRVARRHAIDTRERAERAAYALLVGQVSVPKTGD